MPAGELAARSGFEVALEGAGLGAISEADGGFDAPGRVFCGVGIAALIVAVQSFGKIGGAAGVVPGRVILADEDVDIMVFTGRWHAKP